MPTNDLNFGSSSAPSTISPPIGLGRSSTTNGIPFFFAASIARTIVDTYVHDIDTQDPDVPLTLDMRHLHGCLHALPERERSVVVMTFFEESDASDVAQALGITAGNVRVIRHRAVERLRTCVERGGMHDA